MSNLSPPIPINVPLNVQPELRNFLTSFSDITYQFWYRQNNRNKELEAFAFFMGCC